jgi:hypothetical protein
VLVVQPRIHAVRSTGAHVLVPTQVPCPYDVHSAPIRIEGDPSAPPVLIQGFDRSRSEWDRHRAAKVVEIMHEIAKMNPDFGPEQTHDLEKVIW